VACDKIAGIDGLEVGVGRQPSQPARNDASTGPFDAASIVDSSIDGSEPPIEAGTDPCQLATTADFVAPLDPKWVMRGNASQTANGVQLTPEAATQVGQLYLDDVLTFDAFEVSFGFVIATAGASAGDGFAFSWLDGNAMPIIGGPGGMMGIQGATGFAVVIDTYKNANDPPTPYVALRSVATFANITTAGAFPALADGKEHTLKVKLASGNVTVDVDGTNVLSTAIPEYAPFSGHVSFSAGTGGAKSTHTVKRATLHIGTGGACATP
jgi:hypothetical protein